MQQFNQRKTPIFTLIGLLAIWTFFSVRIFSAASSQRPSHLRETSSIQELSANFTPTKIGAIKGPSEILVLSDVYGMVQTIKVQEGDQVRGGQPILQIQDNLDSYTTSLESAKHNQESIQELYEKTKTHFQQQLQKADALVTDLQHQLLEIEQDLHTILNQPLTISTSAQTCSTDENNKCSEPQSSEILRTNSLEFLSTTEQQLEQAKLDLQILKTNSSNQLEELEQSLQTARYQYEKAYNDNNKLVPRASIAGTIKEIFVTEGEQVRPSDPLCSILKTSPTTHIEVGLTLEEFLSTTDITEIVMMAKNIHGERKPTTGTISFRSPVANEEGIYMLSIEGSEKLDETFSRVQIIFPIHSEFFFLPKELIEIKNLTEGYLYIFHAGELEKIKVPLGIHRNGYIEILEHFTESLQIVTNRRQ